MINDLADKKFIFLIASPRSGTTWLQLMMSAHPQVATTVEIRLFNWYIGPLVRRWNQELEIIGNLRQGLTTIWNQENFDNQIELFIKHTYQFVLKNNSSATHIVDKSTGYAAYLDIIDQYIPNAKYIHLIRDGRDVVASSIKTNQLTKVYGFGNASSASKNWVHNVSRVLQLRGQENYFELTYEDLITNPSKILKELFTFCELPINEEDIALIIQNYQFENVKQQGLLTDHNTKAPEGHFRKGKVGSWVEDLTFYEKYYLSTSNEFNNLLEKLHYVENRKWWTQRRFERFFVPICYYTLLSLSHVKNSLKYLLRPVKTVILDGEYRVL